MNNPDPSIVRSIILATAVSLTGVASPGTSHASHAAHSAMKLMTFNVRLAIASDGINAWEHRKDFLRDVVQEYDPALLGVQEAFQQQLDFITESLPHRASIGEARGGGGSDEYSAIIYDTRRLQALQSETFWLSDTPAMPSASWGNRFLRVCTWARFRDRDSGACLHAFNTHLDHESENARVRAVGLILERIRGRRPDDEPFVLMGDFNAGESSPPLSLITSADGIHVNGAPTPIVDTFRVLHPEATAVGTFHAFTGVDDGRKIDHIFAPGGTEVLAAGIIRSSRDGRHPSDHFPVTAELRFK
ncbi:MAG TPA: endonuclease/exonuclease/phosphatase family protein [Opitutaceae bacterium]